jgi:hypothetical protein
MIATDTKVKQMEISAVITRADGTIENLGTIQYWNKNPLKRLLWRIKKWLHF